MNTFVKYTGILAFGLLALASCQKEYYHDSGIHDPNFDGSAMDFLESRPDLFQRLTQIVKLAGLENTLRNETVTFFAPPDSSISRTVWSLNRSLYLDGRDTVKQLSQIDPSVWRFFLGRYILRGKSLLKDFPQLDTLNLHAFPGQGYLTYDEERMNIGVIYNDIVTKNADGVDQVVKYAGYRQLHINALGGGSISGLTVGPVATSDIQPRNGAVHVLQFSKHSFGFDPTEFIAKVYTSSVKPLNDD